MDDVPRWLARVASAVALMAGLSVNAAQYSAHPDLQQDAVFGQQAAFLTRTAQREVATLFRDARDAERRAAILSIVRAAQPSSDARLTAWLTFMAGPDAAASPVRWEAPDAAMGQAHRWMRVLAQARTASASGDLGVVQIPVLPAWSQRVEALCAEQAPAAWLQSKLLGGKTCRTFVADLLGVVYPHADPMRPLHLEAFSPSLAEDAALRSGLATLRGVRTLNPDVGPVAAVREVLPGWSSLQILRLLALASHNHALEVRLLEHVLAQVPDEKDAARAGQLALSDVGHLYALLGAFYGSRFDKPYHFHGAALVACELIERGYPRPVVALTGNLLGEVYERASAHPDADDVRLHRDGTRYGLAACAPERT